MEVENVELKKIEPKVRGIALGLDVIIIFLAATIFQALSTLVGMLIPGFSRVFSQATIIVVYLLVRDFLFEGRGIGKNLMGLKVIDASTGESASLLQSAKRNIVFFVPFLVQLIVGIALQFSPSSGLTQFVMTLVNQVCMVYVIIAIPLECYFALSRDDGRRLGDRFANTAIVEDQMNFQNPFSKRA